MGLFGPAGKMSEGYVEAWCMAVIMRLVGPLGPPVGNETFKARVELSKLLEAMYHPRFPTMKLITLQNWRQELEDIPDPPVPKDLLEFIGYLLVINPDKRPTAEEALRHPYLTGKTEPIYSPSAMDKTSHGDHEIMTK